MDKGEGEEENESENEKEAEEEEEHEEAEASELALPALEDIGTTKKDRKKVKPGKGNGKGKVKQVIATAEDKNRDNMAAVAQLKKSGKGGRGKSGGKGDAGQLGQTAKVGVAPTPIAKPGKKGKGKDSAPKGKGKDSAPKGKGKADPDANATTPSKPPNKKRKATSSTETPDKPNLQAPAPPKAGFVFHESTLFRFYDASV